jgi:hypothetical protein
MEGLNAECLFGCCKDGTLHLNEKLALNFCDAVGPENFYEEKNQKS